MLVYKGSVQTKQAFVQSGRHSGIMVCALDTGSSGVGSSAGRGHCVVFLGKTLYFHSARSVNGNLAKNTGWTSIPSRGVELLLKLLHAMETKVKRQSGNPLGYML